MNWFKVGKKIEYFFQCINAFSCVFIQSRNKIILRQLLVRENGAISIAFSAFLISIFIILGLVSYWVISVESHTTVNFTQAIQAQYLAEAGIEYGVKKLFQGQCAPYSESVSINGNTFEVEITTQGNNLRLVSEGEVNDAEKSIEVIVSFRPPIGDFAIYSTGDVTNVTPLDEDGNPDFSLLTANADSLPTIDDSTLVALATAQSHVEVGAEFNPAHGYPNFNFYYSGVTPNVTYVQGDLRVRGGRTVYGIFMVEGNIYLEGSSRVEGVLYMTTPSSMILRMVIHGGGNPTQSSVTGGVVANGDVDGTGNHITVNYNSGYMKIFEQFEDRDAAPKRVISWREL